MEGSQNWTDRSLLPDTSHFPSGEKATDKTKSLWPLKVDVGASRGERDVISHSRNVLSNDPEARDLPSGANATEYTESVCPSNCAITVLARTSHKRTILSREP